MGLFGNKYPYSDFHELNLDWIISKIHELGIKIDEWTIANELKFSDPILWDKSNFYDKHTIVLDQEQNTYLSLKDVPAGIKITDKRYWFEIGYYDAKLLLYPVTYNTVADMKAATIRNGQEIVKTLGYYAINDGGAAYYHIVETEPENDFYEVLDNGLFALLMQGDCLPKQLGAYGDGMHDDTEIIKKVFDYAHKAKSVVIDFGGYTYAISECISVDGTYKCTFKNGQFKALPTFSIGSDPYMIHTTNYTDIYQPGSYGYTFEDNTFDNITFDAQFVSGLGCLAFESYFRVKIINCDFRRFATYGIHFSDSQYSDGHECIISDTTIRGAFKDEPTIEGSTGIYLRSKDNLISNVVIALCDTGIYVKGQYNMFENVHLYNKKYNLDINQTAHQSFNNCYFDGAQLRVVNPYWITFDNCAFIVDVDKSPLLFENSGGSRNIEHVRFTNCLMQNLNTVNTVDLIETVGYFQKSFNKNNAFEFTLVARINYNYFLYTGEMFNTSANNSIILNKTNATAVNANGAIVSSALGNYGYTAVGNAVAVDTYNSSGYPKLGFWVPLPKNTKVLLDIQTDSPDGYVFLYGSASKADGIVMSRIAFQKGANTLQVETGDHDYYCITVEGLGSWSLSAREYYN